MKPLDFITSQYMNCIVRSLEGRGFIPSSIFIGENLIVKGQLLDDKLYSIDSTISPVLNTFSEYLVETVFLNGSEAFIDIGEPNSIVGYSSIDINKIISPLPYYDQIAIPIINLLIHPSSSSIVSYNTFIYPPTLFLSNLEPNKFTYNKHLGGSCGLVLQNCDLLGSTCKAENIFYLKNYTATFYSTLTYVEHSFFSLDVRNYQAYYSNSICILDNFFTWDIRKRGFTNSDQITHLIEGNNIGYNLFSWNMKRAILEGNILEVEVESTIHDIFLDESVIQVFGIGGLVSSNIAKRQQTLPVIDVRSCAVYYPWLFNVIDNIAWNPVGEAYYLHEANAPFTLNVFSHNVLDGSISVRMIYTSSWSLGLEKNVLYGKIISSRSQQFRRNIWNNKLEGYGYFFPIDIPLTSVPPNSTILIHELSVSNTARIEIANISVYGEAGTLRIVSPSGTLDFGSSSLQLGSRIKASVTSAPFTISFYLVNDSSSNVNIGANCLVSIDRPEGEYS